MHRRLLFLLLLLACSTNPHTGRRQTLLISEQEEIKLGNQAWAEMTGPKSKAKISTEPDFNAPLQEVGRAIAAAANKPEYEWEFKCIDDPKTVNAWALPGGKIAFYKGIYPILKDTNGMAIVMGHEVSHALLRHSGERISQQMIRAGILVAGAIALNDHKNREGYLVALGVGTQVGMLAYSRKHETEADRYGLMLAARAGYDPEAAIGVWERMGALGGKRPPVFLSTHPPPDDRIENMRKWMPEAKALYEMSDKKPNRPLPVPPKK